jgi:hypothetical protein
MQVAGKVIACMGDRPWQQAPELQQASYPHAGMIQAASSSAHGGIMYVNPNTHKYRCLESSSLALFFRK